eukprot:30926-Pelagococcus_subviridis.AAC.2
MLLDPRLRYDRDPSPPRSSSPPPPPPFSPLPSRAVHPSSTQSAPATPRTPITSRKTPYAPPITARSASPDARSLVPACRAPLCARSSLRRAALSRRLIRWYRSSPSGPRAFAPARLRNVSASIPRASADARVDDDDDDGRGRSANAARVSSRSASLTRCRGCARRTRKKRRYSAVAAAACVMATRRNAAACGARGGVRRRDGIQTMKKHNQTAAADFDDDQTATRYDTMSSSSQKNVRARSHRAAMPSPARPSPPLAASTASLLLRPRHRSAAAAAGSFSLRSNVFPVIRVYMSRTSSTVLSKCVVASYPALMKHPSSLPSAIGVMTSVTLMNFSSM